MVYYAFPKERNYMDLEQLKKDTKKSLDVLKSCQSAKDRLSPDVFK